MLIPFFPQPVSPPTTEVIDMRQVLGDMYPALNASGPGDLIFWSVDELYRWIDETAARLSRTIGCFVERDTSISVVLGQGPYTLPAAQVATVQADVGGAVLRARTVHELEALDSTWSQQQGPPRAFVQDTSGVTQIVIYPMPDAGNAGKTLGLVLNFTPPTIAAGTPLLSAPTVIRDYFSFRTLGEARAKETKAAMPEVATWYRELAGTMEEAMQGYWGAAQ